MRTTITCTILKQNVQLEASTNTLHIALYELGDVKLICFEKVFLYS